MILSKMLTAINLLGAIAAVICLFVTIKHYRIGKFMQFYIFFSFCSMVLLMFTQLYSIGYDIEVNWKVKSATLFWWVKTLYFAWAIRFVSVKKQGESKIRFTSLKKQ